VPTHHQRANPVLLKLLLQLKYTGTNNTKAISPLGLTTVLNENGTDVGNAADDGFTIDCGIYDS